MKKISAKIVADSINIQGDRITTMLLTYPRFIHSEVLTHRVFSKNSASSRAIPFEKMVKMVQENPFIPIAWQKEHKGMQGTEYLNLEENNYAKRDWLDAKRFAIDSAMRLSETGVTKQLCNRLLEPFMWHTVLLTGTEFENFFELRCPQYLQQGKFYKSKKEAILKSHSIRAEKNGFPTTDLDWLKINKGQAEIHMQALAEAMYDAYNESTPKELKENGWHIPFGDKIDFVGNLVENVDVNNTFWQDYDEQNRIKIAVARCARLSYMTFDGEIDYEKDIKLHDVLLESRHMSPFEHCARAMSDYEYSKYTHTYPIDNNGTFDEEEGWCNNFRGWISYRYMIENERLY